MDAPRALHRPLRAKLLTCDDLRLEARSGAPPGVEVPRLEAYSGAPIIEIFDSIDSFLGFGVVDLAAALHDIGSVPLIEIHVKSGGGSSIEGLTLWSLFSMHPARFQTYVLGIAASAASILIQGTDDIAVSEVAQIQVHLPWMRSEGYAKDLRKSADRLDQIEPGIVTAYSRRGKASAAQILSWMAANDGDGTFFSAEEAVSAGLADRVFKAPDLKDQDNAESSSKSRVSSGEPSNLAETLLSAIPPRSEPAPAPDAPAPDAPAPNVDAPDQDLAVLHEVLQEMKAKYGGTTEDHVMSEVLRLLEASDLTELEITGGSEVLADEGLLTALESFVEIRVQNQGEAHASA